HTQFELMTLQEELGITFVVVTHDQEEAMTLSTRIVVMNEGRFEQVGTPGEVYEYPKNRFVADFVGNINLFAAKPGEIGPGYARLHCDQLGIDLTAYCEEDRLSMLADHCWIAVRPEKIFINKNQSVESGRTVLKGIVEDLGYFGNLSVYRVRLANGTILQVSGQNRVRTAKKTVEWDDEVFISWDQRSAILLID
ncbi:MAG: ABC transporter ATP-binding protein, partial [Lysobacterales bacterium]